MEKQSTEIAKVVESKVTNAYKEASAIVIKTDEDLQSAATLLTNIKKLSKWITGEKENILKPLREATSAARALFAPLEEKADEAERKVKLAMITYNDKKEAAAKKKEATIMKNVEAGKISEGTAVKKMEAIGEVRTNVKTEAGATTFKKDKKVRVLDESKVPDEYWIIDMVTLRSAALTKAKTSGALGEVIPGVEVYEETNIAASV